MGKRLCANYVARKLQDHLNCLKSKSQLRSSILYVAPNQYTLQCVNQNKNTPVVLKVCHAKEEHSLGHRLIARMCSTH